jgi:hypothetical protein
MARRAIDAELARWPSRALSPLSDARLERLRARVSLVVLSAASGVSITALSMAERGERPLSDEQERARCEALKRLVAGDKVRTVPPPVIAPVLEPVVTAQQQDAIEAIRQAASEASAAGQLPAFLAAVEQVRVEAVLAAAVPRDEPAVPKTPGRVPTVQQAAARSGAQQVVGLPAQEDAPGHSIPDRRLGVR